MSTTITLAIDDDVKVREEYILTIENATTEEIIQGLTRVFQAAMLSSRFDTLKETLMGGMKNFKTLQEDLNENSNLGSIKE